MQMYYLMETLLCTEFQFNRPNRCAVIEVAILGVLKKCPTLPRATCGGWQERMVTITPQNFYVQVTFSKEDRLSIGYQLFGIPIPNRYQVGIWYSSPNVFGISLVLSTLTNA